MLLWRKSIGGSMAIQKASEHVNTEPLTSYCSADDVRIYLAGLGADDEQNFLGSYFDAGTADAKLGKLLKQAKKMVDKTVGHDFELHEDVEIVVDGNGLPELQLNKYGFFPLIDLTELAIDGYAEVVTDFEVYTDGRLACPTIHSAIGEVPWRSWGKFPRGRLNIEATISWGYEEVPIEIEMATAYFVGYHLLNQLRPVKDLTSPGIAPDITSISYGDTKFNVSSEGRFSSLALWMLKEAKKLCQGYVNTIVTAPNPLPRMIETPTHWSE